MTKSELIEMIARKQTQLSQKDIEIAVNQIVDSMINTLSRGDRIEIRGFGSFSLHHRKARTGRNPKTGESVKLSDKKVPHFKPGKALREAVDESKDFTDIVA
jgi:integration host factor subunit beta